jgi:hypothetical protein
MDWKQRNPMTRHAYIRCAQRGASPAAIELVLAFGDMETPAALGRRILRMSRSALDAMSTESTSVNLVEQAARVALVIGANETIVTVLRIDPAARRDRRPRRMRRQLWRRR